MVKTARLWQEINRQFAKLQDAENQNSSLVQGVEMHSPHALKESVLEHELDACTAIDKNPFFADGLQHKHWVLFLCAMMIMCEWMDRSVLSIALESIKAEFELSDMQTGAVASASLWVVPLTIMFMGRLADHVPRARLLGCGVLGWGVCTIATGSASSFTAIVVIRMLAGLSNCAGYPVAVSLLADFFEAGELTTAMGYFNAGCAVGGLLGMAAGGRLITHLGWRWAFWAIGGPQMILSILLVTTVREKPRAPVAHPWAEDIKQLLRLPTLLLMMLGALLSGLMSGEHRFISALIKRNYGVDEETIGLVLGGVLGSAGIVAACAGGHLVDRTFVRTGDPRTLLWCAVGGDFLHLVLGTCGLLSPTFGLLVTFLVGATFGGAMTQGVDPTIQMLGRGRRGTTQGIMELCWSIGMAIGPFAAGGLSDALENSISCDEGCSLTHSLLIIGGLGRVFRTVCYVVASMTLPEDLGVVDEDQSRAEKPLKEDATPAGAALTEPTKASLGLEASPTVSTTSPSPNAWDTGICQRMDVETGPKLKVNDSCKSQQEPSPMQLGRRTVDLE